MTEVLNKFENLKKKSCFFLLLRPTIQRTLREVKSPEITVGTRLMGTVHPLKIL